MKVKWFHCVIIVTFYVKSILKSNGQICPTLLPSPDRVKCFVQTRSKIHFLNIRLRKHNYNTPSYTTEHLLALQFRTVREDLGGSQDQRGWVEGEYTLFIRYVLIEIHPMASTRAGLFICPDQYSQEGRQIVIALLQC